MYNIIDVLKKLKPVGWQTLSACGIGEQASTRRHGNTGPEEAWSGDGEHARTWGCAAAEPRTEASSSSPHGNFGPRPRGSAGTRLKRCRSAEHGLSHLPSSRRRPPTHYIFTRAVAETHLTHAPQAVPSLRFPPSPWPPKRSASTAASSCWRSTSGRTRTTRSASLCRACSCRRGPTGTPSRRPTLGSRTPSSLPSPTSSSSAAARRASWPSTRPGRRRKRGSTSAWARRPKSRRSRGTSIPS